MKPKEFILKHTLKLNPCGQAESVHDVIGIGFGPSNLALAIAIEERAKTQPQRPIRARFFEKQKQFGWHRGTLIDGARMQISFLKDLVTARCPSSSFTFVSYLHERGRLSDFVNHKTIFPSRMEFHDYLEWAASKLPHCVQYGTDVVDVRPIVRDGLVDLLEVVVSRGSRQESCLTHNLVVASGLEPLVPAGVHRDDRIWHSAELMVRLGALNVAPAQFTVVGAGQSAAEAVAYIHRRFQNVQVRAVFERYGYSAADDSAFVNRIFDPAAVDDFFHAPDDVKERLLNYHKNTNYSVVDPELLAELYKIHYEEMVSGQQRLEFLKATRVLAVERESEMVAVYVQSLLTGERRRLDSDIVVFASGYRPSDPIARFSALKVQLEESAEGRWVASRNHRLNANETFRCGIYLQGATEYSHGLSSSLLSNVAIRAGEILDDIASRQKLAFDAQDVGADYVHA